VKSESGSFRGWSLWVLLAKNVDKIKLLLAAIAGYLTSLVSGIADPALNSLLSTAVGVVAYIAGSALDFWLSRVDLE